MSAQEPVVKRYQGNPILTKADVPYPVETVHNAGMTLHQGRTLMIFRSHRRNGRSILGLAESSDGYRFSVRPRPFLVPATEGAFAPYEEFGVEDPRVCAMEDEGQGYLITYSAYSRHGVRIGLCCTHDFEHVERLSLITECDTRNVVLFPATFGGRFARLQRPHTKISPWSIWIAYSPDLIHWGDASVVMKPCPYHWDEMKIGPGATPLRTPQGWLHIYHGVFETMDGAVYRLGVALHDLEDPTKILGVADDWILQPEDPWEVTGYVHNVVFSCGAVMDQEGMIKLYWGGADTVMCAGTVRADELVRLCLEHGRHPLGG